MVILKIENTGNSDEESKLHEAICKALSTAVPNKYEILKAVKGTLEYAVSGNNDILNKYNIKLNIKQLQDEADMLMDKAASTKGDVENILLKLVNCMTKSRHSGSSLKYFKLMLKISLFYSEYIIIEGLPIFLYTLCLTKNNFNFTNIKT